MYKISNRIQIARECVTFKQRLFEDTDSEHDARISIWGKCSKKCCQW